MAFLNTRRCGRCFAYYHSLQLDFSGLNLQAWTPAVVMKRVTRLSSSANALQCALVSY
jgi:hypothetical protein